MIVLLIVARVMTATAEFALLAKGLVVEALVAAPATLCLCAAWRDTLGRRGRRAERTR